MPLKMKLLNLSAAKTIRIASKTIKIDFRTAPHHSKSRRYDQRCVRRINLALTPHKIILLTLSTAKTITITSKTTRHHSNCLSYNRRRFQQEIFALTPLKIIYCTLNAGKSIAINANAAKVNQNSPYCLQNLAKLFHATYIASQNDRHVANAIDIAPASCTIDQNHPNHFQNHLSPFSLLSV
jgi:hypothetical protein